VPLQYRETSRPRRNEVSTLRGLRHLRLSLTSEPDWPCRHETESESLRGIETRDLNKPSCWSSRFVVAPLWGIETICYINRVEVVVDSRNEVRTLRGIETAIPSDALVSRAVLANPASAATLQRVWESVAAKRGVPMPSTSRDGGEYFGTRRKYRRDLAEYLDGTPTREVRESRFPSILGKVDRAALRKRASLTSEEAKIRGRLARPGKAAQVVQGEGIWRKCANR
jgi:hypothetical protein